MSNIKIRYPRSKTRQARVLSVLLSNSRRNRWTGSVNGVTRDDLLDDISRLRRKGWNIESKSTKNGNRYRISG